MTSDLALLFGDVAVDDVERARGRFYPVEMGRGVTVIEEGENDAAALFLVEGHVAVRTGDFEIATIGPGGIVGEIGLFGGALRIATVETIEPSVFLVLDRRDYEALLDQGNPIADAVERAALRQLGARLRDVDQRLAALSEGRHGVEVARGAAAEGRPADADVTDVLARSSFFEGAPRAALVDLSTAFVGVAYDAGEVLCAQGSAGRELFLLADGLVDVAVRLEDQRNEVLATLEPGDVFGMASALEDRPRMASCVARTPVRALRMRRETCRDRVSRDGRPASVLRVAMIRALGDQIAYANAQFAMLTLARKKRTAELLARLGIEAHGRHVTAPRA